MGTSEHAYGLLMKALFQRQASGEGACIHLSMFESSVSWLTVPITFSASFDKTLSRRGNTHEFFCPVSVYPTQDGFVYLAVGNDRQWKALVALEAFKPLDRPDYEKNAGRIADAKRLNQAISAITKLQPSAELLEKLNAVTVPASRIQTIREVVADPLVQRRLLHAVDPASGKRITLAPAPCTTPFLEASGRSLAFPPRFGEHNAEIYKTALGAAASDLEEWKAKGII
jgi:formyl-CoA transferase